MVMRCHTHPFKFRQADKMLLTNELYLLVGLWSYDILIHSLSSLPKPSKEFAGMVKSTGPRCSTQHTLINVYCHLCVNENSVCMWKANWITHSSISNS